MPFASFCFVTLPFSLNDTSPLIGFTTTSLAPSFCRYLFTDSAQFEQVMPSTFHCTSSMLILLCGKGTKGHSLILFTYGLIFSTLLQTRVKFVQWSCRFHWII